MERQYRSFVWGFVFLITSLVVAGCSTTHYLTQAGLGQLKLSNRARLLTEVIQDSRTPTRLKLLLQEVAGIKTYGEQEGKLKATKNFSTYVDWEGPAVSWLVTASLKLKFEPKTWTFPIVGSFNYLGWFDRKEAQKYAQELLNESKWDVSIRGAQAYSTLGWFNDPLISTMIPESEAAIGELANIIFHESVHSTYYINHQSYFNESLASWVADQLTESFLLTRSGLEKEKYFALIEHNEKKALRLHQTYQALETLYATPLDEIEKKERKQKILESLSKDLGETQTPSQWNNASLIHFKTYGLGKTEFQALWRACSQDWKKFWEEIRKIDQNSFAREQDETFPLQILTLAKKLKQS